MSDDLKNVVDVAEETLLNQGQSVVDSFFDDYKDYLESATETIKDKIKERLELSAKFKIKSLSKSGQEKADYESQSDQALGRAVLLMKAEAVVASETTAKLLGVAFKKSISVVASVGTQVTKTIASGIVEGAIGSFSASSLDVPFLK